MKTLRPSDPHFFNPIFGSRKAERCFRCHSPGKFPLRKFKTDELPDYFAINSYILCQKCFDLHYWDLSGQDS